MHKVILFLFFLTLSQAFAGKKSDPSNIVMDENFNIVEAPFLKTCGDDAELPIIYNASSMRSIMQLRLYEIMQERKAQGKETLVAIISRAGRRIKKANLLVDYPVDLIAGYIDELVKIAEGGVETQRDREELISNLRKLRNSNKYGELAQKVRLSAQRLYELIVSHTPPETGSRADRKLGIGFKADLLQEFFYEDVPEYSQDTWFEDGRNNYYSHVGLLYRVVHEEDFSSNDRIIENLARKARRTAFQSKFEDLVRENEGGKCDNFSDLKGKISDSDYRLLRNLDSLELDELKDFVDRKLVEYGRTYSAEAAYGFTKQVVDSAYEQNPEHQQLFAVNHTLTTCDVPVPAMYSEGLSHFFLDNNDEFHTVLFFPSDEVQRKMLKIIYDTLNRTSGNGEIWPGQPKAYNAFSSPYDTRFGNSNSYPLNVLASAMLGEESLSSFEEGLRRLNSSKFASPYQAEAFHVTGFAKSFAGVKKTITIDKDVTPYYSSHGLLELITAQSFHRFMQKNEVLDAVYEVKLTDDQTVKKVSSYKPDECGEEKIEKIEYKDGSYIEFLLDGSSTKYDANGRRVEVRYTDGSKDVWNKNGIKTSYDSSGKLVSNTTH